MKPWIFWLILVPLFAWFGRDGIRTIYAQPTVSQSYGLTLERDDFPLSQAGDTTFSTPVAARSSFALVFRNGLLQRPSVSCAAVPPPPSSSTCDYTVSGNVTVTFPAPGLAAGDMVTILFYR